MFRRDRQVVQQTEPAKGLPQYVPALDAELFADRLRVLDDLRRAQLRKRIGVDELGRGGVDARRPARAALVQQHDSVTAAQRLFNPRESLARRGRARPSLQKQQRGGAGVSQHASEDGPLASGDLYS